MTSTREIILLSLMGALLVAVQYALAFLPNIELVSLLIILYTLVFRRKVLYIIYLFALIEGLIYGFTIWWTTYLYVWTILAAIAHLFRRMDSPLGWAVLSGAFGLVFGALCEIPWLITAGPRVAAAAWVSGIPFDLVHCIGNFIVALALFRPLYRMFTTYFERS